MTDLSNTYPEQYKQMIYAAVGALAGQCDGAVNRDTVGFNGADTKKGHKLARIPADQWYPSSWFNAWKMIQKYSRQLAAFNINPQAIPQPPVNGAVVAARTIVNRDGSYRISLKGLGKAWGDALAEVKAMPVRRFQGADNIWEVPSAFHVEVIHFAAKYGYDIVKE